MKHALRVGASLILSAAFLYFAARGVHWSEVWAAMADADPLYLVPMAIGSVLPYWFRALRWQVLVRPIREVRVHTLFAATAIGFAGNMLLPLRAGEVIRPWVLARKEGLGFGQAVATTTLERLFDMAALLLFFAVATLTLPLPAEWTAYGRIFLAVFAGLLVGLFALRRHPEPVLRFAASVLRPLPTGLRERILHLARQFAEGLESLDSAGSVALACLYSLAVWLSIGVSFGFGLSTFHLPVPWFRAMLTTTTFVAIAVSVPGGPGFIGMFQAGCVVALALYGVSASVAFSYSVLTHLVQFATTVGLGLYYFLREGLHVSEIRELEREAETKGLIETHGG